MKPRTHVGPGYEIPADRELACSFCGTVINVSLVPSASSPTGYGLCGSEWCADERDAEIRAANAEAFD